MDDTTTPEWGFRELEEWETKQSICIYLGFLYFVRNPLQSPLFINVVMMSLGPGDELMISRYQFPSIPWQEQCM